MFLTDEQVEARLKSKSNLANRFSKNDSGEALENQSLENQIEERVIKSKGKNKINFPKEIRTEIAIRSRLGESQPELAKEFGMTQANVSSIERGDTKGVNEKDAEKVISQVRDKALDRLMSSLGLLTDDKLSGCSAKDLSTIAANMGRVVEKSFPKAESGDKINLIIYTPELKQEKSFKVIEV